MAEAAPNAALPYGGFWDEARVSGGRLNVAAISAGICAALRSLIHRHEAVTAMLSAGPQRDEYVRLSRELSRTPSPMSMPSCSSRPSTTARFLAA